MAGWGSTQTMRVAIFGTESRLASSVQAIVGTAPDMVWVNTGDKVDDVIGLCAADSIDVLLVYSENDPGWKLCLMLASFFPKLTVVALLGAESDNPISASWALLHGARGVIGINAEAENLSVAIRGAVDSGHYVDPALEVSVPLASQNNQSSQLAGRPLSAREFEVLQLIADGRTAEQIGRRLGITTDTARTHIGHILRKLKARDRAHAVAISFQNSLLPARFAAGSGISTFGETALTSRNPEVSNRSTEVPGRGSD